LQNGLDSVSNPVRGGVYKGFCAVTALKEKGFTGRSSRNSLLQSVDLARED
jgi:hypothetical protein